MPPRRLPAKRPPLESLALPLADGTVVEVALRRSARAKRLTLRVSAGDGRPVMTVPRRVALSRARAFLVQHRDWLSRRLADRPAGVPFVPGATFPLEGRPAIVTSDPSAGGVVFQEDGEGWRITVGGPIDTLSRRLEAALRARARTRFAAATRRYADALGRTVAAIRITDTTSRWGSCSSARVLSFSWRLILAPPEILDGLAAHEVAHLAEMNHSPRFWALLDRLDPRHREARTWLSGHGARLHAVGRASLPRLPIDPPLDR